MASMNTIIVYSSWTSGLKIKFAYEQCKLISFYVHILFVRQNLPIDAYTINLKKVKTSSTF